MALCHHRCRRDSRRRGRLWRAPYPVRYAAGHPRAVRQPGRPGNREYQKDFGGSLLEVIFEGDPRKLVEGDNLNRLRALQAKINADKGFFYVLSPLTLLDAAEQDIPRQVQQGIADLQAAQQKAETDARAQALAQGKSPADADKIGQDAGAAAIQKFIADHAAEQAEFEAVGETKVSNPKFVEFVMFQQDGTLRPEITGLVPDTSHALLIAALAGNLSVNEQNDAAARLQQYINDAHFEGLTTKVAGENLLLKDISDSLQSSLPLLGIISGLLMLVVVLSVFRARWRLLHLPVVALALVIAFGIVGYMDLPLTMASTAGLPILVALSVDFGIQFHNRYEEELERSHGPLHAMRKSLAAIGPALVTALIAACLGFAALRYSEVPMVRDFSLVLSIGIGVVFVVCLFVLNGLLFHRDRAVTGAVPPQKESWVERFLAATNRATVRRALPILLLGIIVAVAGFALENRITTETEPEQFIPSDSQTLKDLNELSDLTATANTIDFLVTAPDAATPEVIQWMYGLGNSSIARDGRVTSANSLATLMATGTATPDFSAQAISDALDQAPPDVLKGIISPDRKAATLSLTIGRDVKLIDQKTIIDEVGRTANPPPGVTIRAAGLGVIGVEAETRLTSHRLAMTLLALSLTFVLLLAVTRNAIYALLGVLPVGLVIGWTSAAMYVFKIPLNPLTSISGPLVVALGTEFSILLMLRYREERQNGLPPAEAMSQAYVLSGRAIAASAFTVIGAFLALVFHPFPLLSQFGSVAVIGVALSFAGAMLVMPPLLVWADETLTPVAEETPQTQQT